MPNLNNQTTRDPRQDPRRGDVVTNGRETFYVTGVRSETVTYTDAPPVEESSISLADWRRFAKGDQVVTRAD